MKKTIHIEGMQCSHCAGLLNIQLFGIKEVIDAKIDIRDKTAIIALKNDVDDSILIRAVEKAGFTVSSIN